MIITDVKPHQKGIFGEFKFQFGVLLSQIRSCWYFQFNSAKSGPRAAILSTAKHHSHQFWQES